MPQITVRQEDMEAGVINSPTSDPIALAAQRIGMRQPVVGRKKLFYSDAVGRRWMVLLPTAVTKFIDRLAYGDRHEMLKLRRTKRGDFHHEPFIFTIGIGEPI